MSLSCSCDFDSDCDWYWWNPEDYQEFKPWRGKRCCTDGCNTMIRHGATCTEFYRSRPGTMWEIDRGIADEDPESVWLCSFFMCEECSDLYFSFVELGFNCVSPEENMRDLAKQYHDIFQKKHA